MVLHYLISPWTFLSRGCELICVMANQYRYVTFLVYMPTGYNEFTGSQHMQCFPPPRFVAITTTRRRCSLPAPGSATPSLCTTPRLPWEMWPPRQRVVETATQDSATCSLPSDQVIVVKTTRHLTRVSEVCSL